MVGSSSIQTSLIESLSFLALRITVMVSCVYFLSKFVLPLILDHIAKSAEFLFLFTIAWCFCITSLVNVLGLSLEIGAIVAGLSLGSSPYQPEISSRIRPLRDFFLIMFFVLLGSQMSVSNFSAALLPALGLSAFVLIMKPVILYFLFRVLKFTRRNSFLTGTTGAQVSEFGFILLFAGQNLGFIGESELAIFTLTALITIFISSYIITYNEELYRFCIPFFALFGKDKYQQTEDAIAIYDVWVIGYHRMGWKICETLRDQKKSFAVIDFNPETVKHLRNQNIPAYFGDVADVEFLTELPLEKAKLVISTIPEPDDQFTLIKHIRSLNHKPHIIANLHQAQYMKDFYAAGVNYIMMPHMLGGYRISEILRNIKLSHTSFKKLRHEQEQEMSMRFSARAHD
jgi:Trk K+ transport system NAD-binding subunit